MLSQGGMILGAYLAAGRTGSIATCLLLGFTPWHTLIIALFMDLLQIPVYGFMLESTRKHVSLPKRVEKWIEKRTHKMRTFFHEKVSGRGWARFRPFAIMAVSGIPMRGFGVLSACILALAMGYRRFSGTCLIMAGSLVSSLVIILLCFYPVRWVHGL